MVEGEGQGVTGLRLLFVTGKLAASALRRTLEAIAPRAGFACDVAVLPISVASLATTRWIASHLHVPPCIDRVILPGLCQGDLAELSALGVPVERGPADLRDLPAHFGTRADLRKGYGTYDLTILAEINHAPRLSLPELLQQARLLAADGADLIDLGCDPGSTWAGVAEAVRVLRAEGLRVSIDTFDPWEASAATAAGAELVLSVNSSNARHAADWGAEVVVVPDAPLSVDTMEATISLLVSNGVRFRLDPILEPVGMGFAASLGRYLESRRRFPDAEILMGVGNVTELTDADSCAINVLLAGFCQEAGIRSVLTTQVVGWARSSVKELDLARRLMRFAVERRMPPKRLEPDLVLLRDPRPRQHGPEGLAELAAGIKDRNYRLFAEDGKLHAMRGGLHLSDEDAFALFARLASTDEIDASHAFYLGYELAKATTALTLGKDYSQDQALSWGFLTRPERSRHS